jgi:pilus assembly protein Flp/PilA
MPYQQLLGVDMLHYMQRVLNAREEEKGASAVEYGLLVAAIAAIIVLIVFAIGKFVKQGFSDTCSGLATGSYSTSVDACP